MQINKMVENESLEQLHTKLAELKEEILQFDDELLDIGLLDDPIKFDRAATLLLQRRMHVMYLAIVEQRIDEIEGSIH